jgi:hypothetical protein
VVGIDPGKSGGVAIIPAAGVDPTRRLPAAAVLPYPPEDDQPDTIALADLLRGPWVIARVGVEDVNSHGMGRQSAFVFGQGVGAILAVLAMLRLPVVRVRPQDWQRTIGATRKGGARDPLGPVSRLFPGVDLRPGGARVPHMGIVDALGIAEHVRASLADPIGGLPFG